MATRTLAFIIGRVSLPGLALGLVFFAAALTPSLIPRGPAVQGVLGGLVMGLGYMLALIAGLVWRAADMPRLTAPPYAAPARALSAAALLAAGGLFVWVLTRSLTWQNALREKMGLPAAEALDIGTILTVAAAVFTLCYLLGRAVAGLFRLVRTRLYRVMPPRRANVLGVLVVGCLLFVITRDGLYDRVVTGLDASYETAQELFERAPPPPEDPLRTGSAESLIAWDAIGKPGRDFILTGPDAAAIEAFTGAPALEPIRVYVGRANAETPEARAALALEELKRQGAFERAVLVIASPTGTGWMDPGAHDPVEFMHGGDIATVSAQYSYLQSPLALILETRTGLDQATALQDAVHGYWTTLPPETRPRLYVHGLSLGAWSSMYATNLFRMVGDPIDGAFWAGPPFPSDFWNYVQARRNPDSPFVLPEIGDGALVRYASRVADASQAEADWGDMRIVFLQYSSDPIVFYDPASLWRAPPWMRDAPAEDMSEHFNFMPLVTQFQLALDMALSFGAPPGHGHAYVARDYIPPWVAVTAPAGWTAQDTTRLIAHCDLGFQMGCATDSAE